MTLILVTGSRTWHDDLYIWKVLDGLLAKCLIDGEVVLHHGFCPSGADSIADMWAFTRRSEGKPVVVVRHPAKWRNEEGVLDRRAGFRRNAEMVDAVRSVPHSAECHAFIRQRSPGATHCANLAAKAGIPVIRHRWEDR